jgi:hypothetical protein
MSIIINTVKIIGIVNGNLNIVIKFVGQTQIHVSGLLILLTTRYERSGYYLHRKSTELVIIVKFYFEE